TVLVEPSERGESPLEGVRGHVVRERATAGDRICSTPGVAPVAAEEGRGSLSVAAAGFPDEISVTRLTHSSAVLYERDCLARPSPVILPRWLSGKNGTMRS